MFENAKAIWLILIAAGMSEVGAAAMLGNMQAESALRPDNAQDNMSKLTDDEYTAFVNMGTYANFATDAVGYGLCQWTYSTRKRELLRFAKSTGASIGDLTMQVNFCVKELKQDYSRLWAFLSSTEDLSTAVSRICVEYERPAVDNSRQRLRYAEAWYTALKGVGVATADKPATAFWPPRTIDTGMEGADVAVWQAVMAARGYKCPITGEFDYDTLIATLEFQRAAGLKDDGIPGPLSWGEALRR